MRRLFEELESEEPKPIITDEELIRKCQENPWLKQGGVMFAEDPFAEMDYGYSFYRCKDKEDLKKCLLESDAIRSGCILDNLAFVNQVNGGDEFWTVKKFADGDLIAFESISARPIIRDGEFDNLIYRFEKATKQQCKNLTY